MACGNAAFAANYYVDAVSGNDANNGLSPTSAWKSLAKVNAPPGGTKGKPGAFVAGDTINFRSGQTFNGTLAVLANGASGNPVIYRSYDVVNGVPVYADVPQAILRPTSALVDGVNIDARSHVTLTNLKIHGLWSFTDPASINNSHHGIQVTGIHTNLTLDRLEVTGFSGRGIDVHNSSNASPTQNLRITGCYVHHTGLATIRVRGNWKQINHLNTYIADCYTSHSLGYGPNGVPNNDLKPGGIEISQARNALVEYSEAHYHGGGPASMAAVGIWGWDCDALVIQYCYATNNKKGGQTFDGGGFDLDGGCVNSVVQYCYSHDNDGPGQFVCHFVDSAPTQNNVIRYNISINDAKANANQGALNFYGAASHSYIYNNLFIGGNATGHVVSLESGNTNTVLLNNIFIATGTNNILRSANSTSITYRNNTWWSTTGAPKFLWGGVQRLGLAAWRTASGQETLNGQPVGLEVDPKLLKTDLTQPITTIDGRALTAYDLPRLTGYMLGADSPLRDAGIDVAANVGAPAVGYTHQAHPGARDFFGNAVLVGAAYDMGPHELAPGGEEPPPPPPPPPTDPVAVTYEAESLPVVVSSGATLSSFSETGASGGVCMFLTAPAAGHYVEFTVTVEVGATYDVTLRYKAGGNRGIAQLMINGVNHGAPVDQYGTAAYRQAALGAVQLTSGVHQFRLLVTGKNAASTAHNLTADSLHLAPQ